MELLQSTYYRKEKSMDQKIEELLKGITEYKFLIDVIFSNNIKQGSYQYYEDLEEVAKNRYITLNSKKVYQDIQTKNVNYLNKNDFYIKHIRLYLIIDNKHYLIAER